MQAENVLRNINRIKLAGDIGNLLELLLFTPDADCLP